MIQSLQIFADTPRSVVFADRTLISFRIHLAGLLRRLVSEIRRWPGDYFSTMWPEAASQSLLVLPSHLPFPPCVISFLSLSFFSSLVQLPFIVQSCPRQIFDRLSIRSLRSFGESCLRSYSRSNSPGRLDLQFLQRLCPQQQKLTQQLGNIYLEQQRKQSR